VLQRLRPLARTLAYELTAVEGVNLLRDVITSYVSGGRDTTVALVDRDRDGDAALDAFGLMHLLQDIQNSGLNGETRRAALVLMSPGPTSDQMVESWMFLARESEALQGAGFAPLIHQDVLKLARVPVESPESLKPIAGFREVTKADEPLIRMLHMRCAPKITYQAELTADLLRDTGRAENGWVLNHGTELVASITLRHGRRGYGLGLMFRPKAA
jgi:hypothetical protein